MSLQLESTSVLGTLAGKVTPLPSQTHVRSLQDALKQGFYERVRARSASSLAGSHGRGLEMPILPQDLQDHHGPGATRRIGQHALQDSRDGSLRAGDGYVHGWIDRDAGIS